MDGGGRLDQPLTRSGQSAAERIGAPVDEPRRARADLITPPRRRTASAGLARLVAGWPAAGPRGSRICRPASASSASILLLAATLGYGVGRGRHVSRRHRLVQGRARRRREFASAFASRRSRSPGEKEISREEILTTAGVTGRTSLLFLDADAARARLMANPWIADAAVLKLYPDRLQITITERQAFALWQKDGRVSVIAEDGTVLEPFVAAAIPACRWSSGAGAERRAKDFLAVLDRYPDIRVGAARFGPGRRTALEPAAEQRHRRASAGDQCRAGARPAGRARPRQEASFARRRLDRSAHAGSRHRAPVRTPRPGARGGPQGNKKKKKGGDA